MSRTARTVYSVILAVAMATSAQPLAATTVEECYAKVLDWCAAAMDGAHWWQKVAIGDLCIGMLAGCTGAHLIK